MVKSPFNRLEAIRETFNGEKFDIDSKNKGRTGGERPLVRLVGPRLKPPRAFVRRSRGECCPCAGRRRG